MPFFDPELSLGTAAYDYFAGGAGDEITLRDNVAAWSRYALRPRVLVDVSELDRRTTLLGVERPHPIIVAPMAYQRHAHPDGEIGMARAAAATDSTMVLSTQTTTSPADVAAAAPGANRWFQLYVFKDRQVSYDLVAAAKEAGYEALVLTVDFAVAGIRERVLKSGFQVEYPIAINTAGTPMTTEEIYALHDPALTWDSIAEFAEMSGMPVILKGILRPDDAELAVQAGAAGVIVSNHGGRQLDTSLSGADALGPVAEAIAGRIDVLVDGGIRRGWDVAKAKALGADAVLVGRQVLWGLAADGPAGAELVLRTLLAEFDNALALTGCPKAADLDSSYVQPAPWR
ncbi:MAG: alpha-hydroxy-acid oxidizing protein [Actinomycetota bacterium]|nr:alpha-hydroxy-acid oxidizing protein [Actinomycetota bacterium]